MYPERRRNFQEKKKKKKKKKKEKKKKKKKLKRCQIKRHELIICCELGITTSTEGKFFA
jgi:mannitol-specific phosphotransferase system IIBC component